MVLKEGEEEDGESQPQIRPRWSEAGGVGSEGLFGLICVSPQGQLYWAFVGGAVRVWFLSVSFKELQCAE